MSLGGVYVELSDGGGYSQDLGGYFVHDSVIGAQFGDVEDPEGLMRGRAGFAFTLRGGENGLRLGPGGLLELLFVIARTRGPSGIFLIGPRLEVSGTLPQDASPNGSPAHGGGAIFAPGFVSQWIFAMFYGEPRRPRPIAPPPPPAPPP